MKTLNDTKPESILDTLTEKVSHAQNIVFMQHWFTSQLSCNRAFEHTTEIELHSIRIIRLKAGRRCLLEYCCTEKKASKVQVIFFIGKIRTRHSAKTMFKLMNNMWKTHFGTKSLDDILIPEPIGYVSECDMWLQRKVIGHCVTSLLFSGDSNNIDKKIALGRKISKAANKIHTFGPNTKKYHGVTEEMDMLEDRLDKTSETKPELKSRLAQLLIAGNSISQQIDSHSLGNIHRDFYSDQLIVDDNKLYLLDFDLYCKGNLSLDIGNFVAHMIEQSLREKQDSKYLSVVEDKIIDQYLIETNNQNKNDIHIYATLTLMRHIYISTLFEERRSFTQHILSLCEERLETFH